MAFTTKHSGIQYFLCEGRVSVIRECESASEQEAIGA
jgi:hypothetical protein